MPALLRIPRQYGHARYVNLNPTTYRRKRKAAAATALGAAGLGLSLVGSASASTLPVADIPQSDNN
jgi:hypothetical protein